MLLPQLEDLDARTGTQWQSIVRTVLFKTLTTFLFLKFSTEINTNTHKRATVHVSRKSLNRKFYPKRYILTAK